MAPVLGRLGAGAVFTSFIMIFFVERPLMAYRGAGNVGTVRSGVYLISWRARRCGRAEIDNRLEI